MLVDTHVHVIAEDRERYPLQPSRVQPGGAASTWYEESSVTVEQLAEHMRSAGVDRATLVQAKTAYGHNNDYAADSASLYPETFAAVCSIDVLADDAIERLRYWVRERGMAGVRLFTATESGGTWLDGPKADAVWGEAASLEVPICIFQMDRGALPQLKRLLKRLPTVPVALDHLSKVGPEHGPPFDEARALFDLAELPNLYLKLSVVNLDGLVRAGADSRAFLEQLFDAFGARRVMWGTNFPATHDRGYEALMEAGKEALSFLSPPDQDWVFGETALSLWPQLRGADVE